MNFVSCFSGIEAASVAWHPLGFNCLAVAEVDPFPCAVLAHHYLGIPNLGNVLADDFLDRVAELVPDVIVGGPPCQDFSVAGFRAGIHGDRGNLTLRWVQIIHASRARFAVTENVPGWLSANDGHAFGAFIAGLVGHDTALLPPKDCGGRWTNSGMVAGPLGRCAWRILDAQYFGLAQRRKRVFVVFCPGNRNDPAAILFEPKSVRRDIEKGREKRERIAASLTRGADSSGNGGYAGRRREDDENLAYGISPDCFDRSGEAATGTAGDRSGLGVDCEIAYAIRAKRPGGVAMALNAHGGSGRLDGESETFVCQTAESLTVGANQTYGFSGEIVAHSLRADGFDASEDGTGRGTPLVACDVADSLTIGANQAYGFSGDICVDTLHNEGIRQGNRYASASQTNSRAVLLRVRQEIGAQTFTEWGLGILHSFHPEKILRPTVHGQELRQATFSRSWVVCCTLGSPFSRAEGAMRSLREACGERCPSQGWEPLEQCADELGAYLSELSQPGAQAERFMRDLWQTDEGPWLLREALPAVQKIWRRAPDENQPTQSGSAVRRLTATEREFLQGFPRNYTLIPYRGKPAADGPRYRALGNSMPVPVMSWIGQRIAKVEHSQ